MITFFLVLTLLLITLLPLAAAIALRRRWKVPWWLFLAGGLAFALAQALHLPLNDWLTDLGWLETPAAAGTTILRSALLLGLTAGLSETLARTAGFALLRRQGHASRWADAVMFGLGHGGIEAMGLIGVLTAAQVSALTALRGADLAALDLPAAQMALVTQQLAQLESSPWRLLLAFGERAIAVALHVGLSVLVWRAFDRRRPWLVIVAVAIHASVDATAVYAGQRLEEGLLWLLLFLLIASPLFIWAWQIRPRQAPERQLRGRQAELRAFGAAFVKELRQAWRTRRALIILVVFLLFGMGSPLLARFTPAILGSVEGVEQFADLIPEPTRVDALTQYVKNLTQFGFIIAVVIGMAAVAGEKEKGIASLILTKPLPRWAFVLSKFLAQASLYAIAFLLAALGAAYYTSVLFEPLALGPFLWGNVLLLIWLLVFVAVSLLGSTLAGSVGAAAGIGLAGSVVLLIAGSLPKIGPFMPGALVAWAGQLGLDLTPAPNGGALMAGVVLIILCLLGAVAAIEEQEL
jgi:ABC-2 type transport system permease protein